MKKKKTKNKSQLLKENRMLHKAVYFATSEISYDIPSKVLDHLATAAYHGNLDWKEFNGALRFLTMFEDEIERKKEWVLYQDIFGEKNEKGKWFFIRCVKHIAICPKTHWKCSTVNCGLCKELKLESEYEE